MTSKTTKAVLLSVLIAAVVIPTSVFANEDLYSQLFPDAKVSDKAKEKVAANLESDEARELPTPQNQQALGKKAHGLMIAIEKAGNETAKAALQKQLDELTVDMLKAGMVIREKYESDPEVWDELLREFETKKDNGNVTQVSHKTYEYQAGVQYKYWCYSGLIVCQSSWLYSSLNEGDIVSPPTATLPSYATHGFLVSYNSMKYLGEHAPHYGDTTDSWFSVKSGSTWVDSCYDWNAWTFSYNGQKHTWTVCTSDDSDGGNKLYTSIRVN